MATYTTKSGHERLERFEYSWETNASDEAEFGGVKRTEIKTDKAASDAQKTKIALAEAEVKRLKTEHKTMINASMERCDFIVDAVVGDRRYGSDSTLYEGFGYVRESDKKKGGKKKTKPTL